METYNKIQMMLKKIHSLKKQVKIYNQKELNQMPKMRKPS